MIGILIVLITVSFRLSTGHFVYTTFASCELASKCNHTWVPICGKEQKELIDRLFVDECDMHEYNCDHRKAFVQAEMKTCAYKCTARQAIDEELHQVRDTIPADRMTTPSMSTATHETTTQPTIQSTTPPATQTTTIETTTESTIKATTESTTQATTESTAQATTESTTQATTESTTEATTESTTRATTQSTTQATTQCTSEPTTQSSTEPTTETESYEEYSENKNSNEINTSGATSEESKTTVPATKDMTTTNSIPNNINCDEQLKDCFVPSTWETTVNGESRDFYQILRQRFGGKVTMLKHTTHFPKSDIFVERIGDSFFPSHHEERVRRNVLQYNKKHVRFTSVGTRAA